MKNKALLIESLVFLFRRIKTRLNKLSISPSRLRKIRIGILSFCIEVKGLMLYNIGVWNERQNFISMTKRKEITNPIKDSPKEGLEMYFSPDVSARFAELEQNEKNYRVSAILDDIIVKEMKNLKEPIFAAELGGGAHPDRYHNFFNKMLKEPGGRIDWVDISPYMLDLAKKYLEDKKYTERRGVIKFIENDILAYLEGLKDETLDLSIMKYTIDHIKNIEELFKLLSKKLKKGGKLISTADNLNPELKSYSTNARFLYNGEEFPDDETRTLKDGDSFTIKFFKESGRPESGYLKGAETVKYYHSPEKIAKLAKKFNFDSFLGDWEKKADEDGKVGENMDQDILILTKK